MVEPILQCSAGLDVHKMSVVATVQCQGPNGELTEQTRSFTTFKRGRQELCRWLKDNAVELAVMESTGSYWKSIYASLEGRVRAAVVNAYHVRRVPGRKTDVTDSQWLASLARYGLLRASFIPPRDLRELRLISRQRTKLQGILAGEKNRLHKVLDDAGIRLGGVVSDINGISAQAIIDGLIQGQSLEQLAGYVQGRLRRKLPEVVESVDEPLGARHRFVLEQLRRHIRYLEQELGAMDEYLFAAMNPYQSQWELLQTLPGVDRIAAAHLIVELGVDMERFGAADALASWAGMCPGNNESAGKRHSGKTRKGNRALRRLLCEIANAARKTSSQFKGYYHALVIRRGHKRTIVALGHKLLRVIYAMLKHGVAYCDPQVDYDALQVHRNAPRWIRALKRYGYWPRPATRTATS